MNHQHTQGEWTLYDPAEQRPTTARGNPADKRIMVLHPDGQRVIACMETGYVHPTRGPIPREERIANARLIAHAPKMLAALERLTLAATRRETTMGDPIGLMDKKAELEDAAREATKLITQATQP